MSIVINGNGSIQGISAGGLPDGSVTTDDLASTLDLSGKTVTLPSGTGGKVLQVSSTASGANRATSSTSFVASGLSRSITPSSTSNQILILLTLGSIDFSGSGYGYVELYRDGSSISQVGTMSHPGAEPGWTTFTFVDSPASTSSLTYEMYYKATSGTTFYVRESYGYCTMTVMEIAG